MKKQIDNPQKTKNVQRSIQNQKITYPHHPKSQNHIAPPREKETGGPLGPQGAPTLSFWRGGAMFSWIFFHGFQFKDFVKIPCIPFDFSPIFVQENLLGRACRPPIFPQNAHPQVIARPANGSVRFGPFPTTARSGLSRTWV